MKAFITGLAGLDLSPDERAFLRDARPVGVIVFARNVASRDQLRSLLADAADAVGHDMLTLVDQEGGRVQRLRPPAWRQLPPAACYAHAAQELAAAAEQTRLVSRLVAEDLRAVGLNCNCTPVLDTPVSGAHGIIGDRALGSDAATIIAIGRAIAAGHLAGGVLPVIKHIPGHGRATADSHLELPRVDTPLAELVATDFEPFQALADLPAAMTAHIVFEAIDPDAPASTSNLATQRIIRDAIGFDGLLMSDDLSMRALTGTMRTRAAAVISAGSDLALHCNGELDEMVEVAESVPLLEGRSLQRFERALAVTRRSEPFDREAAEACLVRILALPAALWANIV